MEINEKFISYQKVLIFGSHGSGKSSLTKSIEKDISGDDEIPLDGKI